MSDAQQNLVRDKIRRVLDGAHRLLIKIAKSKNMRVFEIIYAKDKVLQYFSTVLCLNLDKEKIFNM